MKLFDVQFTGAPDCFLVVAENEEQARDAVYERLKSWHSQAHLWSRDDYIVMILCADLTQPWVSEPL